MFPELQASSIALTTFLFTAEAAVVRGRRLVARFAALFLAVVFLAVLFLAVLFFAVLLVGARRAVVFLAVLFLAVLLVGARRAVVFFAVLFLAVLFLAVVRRAVVFVAAMTVPFDECSGGCLASISTGEREPTEVDSHPQEPARRGAARGSFPYRAALVRP